MFEQAERLIEALDRADSVTITAPAGTDLVLGLKGRWFVSDAKVSAKCPSCNLPCGEVYTAPVEDQAEGVVVIDGPIGGEGVPPSPVTLKVKGGQVVEATCADPRWQTRVNQLLDTDEGARTIAELGIGLNPGARLVGLMLEDEKAHRTAHVAFGCNIGLPGGVNDSKTHVDYLIHRPTIIADAEDGSRTVILEDGEIRV
jgi:leucyl aminopeptidase (aminopeptidase T)